MWAARIPAARAWRSGIEREMTVGGEHCRRLERRHPGPIPPPGPRLRRRRFCWRPARRRGSRLSPIAHEARPPLAADLPLAAGYCQRLAALSIAQEARTEKDPALAHNELHTRVRVRAFAAARR